MLKRSVEIELLNMKNINLFAFSQISLETSAENLRQLQGINHSMAFFLLNELNKMKARYITAQFLLKIFWLSEQRLPKLRVNVFQLEIFNNKVSKSESHFTPSLN
jgi:hypothetical protein